MLRWEGLLGAASTVRVHGSVSVFNIAAKEETESVPVFGVGTVPADSKGNAEVKLADLNALLVIQGHISLTTWVRAAYFHYWQFFAEYHD